MKKIFLFISLFLSSAAWADCEFKYKNSSDVAACNEQQSFADVEFNYNKLFDLSTERKPFNPTVMQQLRMAQAAWLDYRNRYCKSYINYHDEANNHANCIIQLNRLRAEQLQTDIDAN